MNTGSLLEFAQEQVTQFFLFNQVFIVEGGLVFLNNRCHGSIARPSDLILLSHAISDDAR